jgi:hypothetical protein
VQVISLLRVPLSPPERSILFPEICALAGPVAAAAIASSATIVLNNLLLIMFKILIVNINC